MKDRIVFDLDGTLVDSRPEIFAAMAGAWSDVVGADVPFPHERFRIGPPLVESVAMLAPALGEDARTSLIATFRRRYDASDFSATPPYPGILDALAELASGGAALAVATNKRRAPTLAILERWFPGRFPRVACIDGTWPDEGTARAFDKTEMIRWCEGTVMVGDTAADVMAARAAGARAIAVTWGYGDARALEAAGADVVVRSAAELVRAVRLA